MSTIDVYVASNIGSLTDVNLILPTVFTMASGLSRDTDIISQFNTGTSIERASDVLTFLTLSDNLNNQINTNVLFQTNTYSYLLNDTKNQFRVLDAASGTLNTITNFQTNNEKDNFIKTQVNVQCVYPLSIYTNNAKVSTYINNKITNFIDTKVTSRVNKLIDHLMTPDEFRIFKNRIKNNDTIVDLEFPIIISSSIYGDVFSSIQKYKYINSDISIAPGRIIGVTSDIFSTNIQNKYITSDIFSSQLSTKYINSDIEIPLSNCVAFPIDFIAAGWKTDYIQCDFRTWSLYIADFFLDVEEFSSATSIVWVDLLDYVSEVDEGNSYFLIDGQKVDVTFSGILNGKRMFYDPPEDFISNDVLIYTAHAANILGDEIEQDYNLIYGYNVTYNKVVDWGPNKEVDILVTAKNKAICPNTVTEFYKFKTKDYDAFNISSTIKPVENVDIGSEIRTQSTHFYYGKTYSITISGVKDLAGNEMGTYTWSFTIEDPTN